MGDKVGKVLGWAVALPAAVVVLVLGVLALTKRARAATGAQPPAAVPGASPVAPPATPAANAAAGLPASAPAVPVADPDASLSLEAIERKYENQPMSNIPAASKARLKANVATLVAGAAQSKQATNITWGDGDFGHVIFAGGPRPAWDFLVRSPSETSANLAQVQATFDNPSDLLRRMGLNIQHLGFFDSSSIAGILKLGTVAGATALGGPAAGAAAGAATGALGP